MPAQARVEIEIVGAEEASARVGQIGAAMKRLEAHMLAGNITHEKYRQIIERLKVAQGLLRSEMNTGAQTMNRYSQSVRHMGVDVGRARDSVQLLGNTLGVQIPREIEKVIAQSKLVGPVMGAAFNVAVLAGFAGAIVALVPKIGELIDKLYDWDGANKRVMEGAREMNKVLLEGQAARRKFEEEITLIGLKGAARIGGQQQFQDARIREAQLEFDRVGELVRLAQEMSKQTATRMVGTPGFRFGAHSVTELTNAAKKAADELGKEGGLRTQLAKAEGHLARMIESSHILGREMKLALGEEATQGAEKLREKLETIYKLQLRMGVVKLSDLEDKALSVDLKTGLDVLGQRAKIFDAARKAAGEIGVTGISATSGIHVPGSRPGPDFADVMASQAQRYRDAAIERFREIQEAHQQMVQDMAAHLRAFVANPLQYLKEKFMSAMFEMGASFLLAFQGKGATGVPSAPGQQRGGFFGNLLGGIFGGGGSFRTPPFLPASAATAGGSAASVGFDPFGGMLGGMLGGGSLSSGNPLSLGATLPPGASLGQRLKAQLPGLGAAGILGGGLLGAQMLGFGGPGRGAASGAIMGAAGLGAWAVGAGGNIMQSLGFLFGGPIGWLALGASVLVGLLFGMSNRSKKRKQRDELERQAFKAIDEIKRNYKTFGLDGGSAVMQLEQLRQQFNDAMRQMKWPSRMDTHFDTAIREIENLERTRQVTGQDILGLARPEFAIGGRVPGSMGQAVPIVAHAGEVVLNRVQQSMVGADRIQRAFRSTGARSAGAGASFVNGGTVERGRETHVHISINAVDADSFRQFLARGGGAVIVEYARQKARGQGLRVPF